MAKPRKRKYKNKERERINTLTKNLQKLKGKYFSGLFTCIMCGHTHMTGYFYSDEDKEYELCKYCNDIVFKKKNKPRLVLTPMGNNQ